MTNPDNFIFHSDFWYPTGFYYGTKEYNNVSIPAQFEMSDKYQPGDFYNVYLEYPPRENYPGIIGERFISDTITNYTEGNKLMVAKNAQFVGAKFTAKLHWRTYPKNKVFNFLTSGNLEQTAKSLNGSYTTTMATNVHMFTIPSGLTGKYFVRGVWQINNGNWGIVGGPGINNASIQVYYDYTNNLVNLNVDTYPEILPVGSTINYRLQLVPIEPQETFVFNSERYSFALPKTYDLDITDSATIPANGTRTVYGDWVEIPGTKQAYDVVLSWNGRPNVTQLHWAEYGFVMNGTNAYHVVAQPSVETSGKMIRPVLKMTNYSTSSRSYANQKVTFSIFVYQNNNSS